MAMHPAGLRRNFKNIVHNYSEAQVKTREATSNDPWGPSSTIMSEIADLTYNVMAFSEIMNVIWKRLNDHGKNWRHVYKALVLLEYLIKTGTEKVAQQCKENIFAIQTLKDFQHIEENKDQGLHVREKAKQLVALLKDDERLKNERTRAIKAKERFAQNTTGVGSTSEGTGTGRIRPRSGSPSNLFQDSGRDSSGEGDGSALSNEMESARPQTAGEEELQLQLALAMSKEEADQEDQKRRSDDVRLQMAITQSEEDFKLYDATPPPSSGLADLLDITTPVPAPSQMDPWGVPFKQNTHDVHMNISDPWGEPPVLQHPHVSTTSDPWSPSSSGAQLRPSSVTSQPAAQSDPWSSPAADPWGAQQQGGYGSTPSLTTNGDLDEFEAISTRPTSSKSSNNIDLLAGGQPNPFNNGTGGAMMQQDSSSKKTAESFLGENSALVNLDNLVSSKPPSQSPGSMNPFASTAAAAAAAAAATAVPVANTFQPPPQPRLTINQIRTQQHYGSLGMSYNAVPEMQPIVANPVAFNVMPQTSVQPMTNNPFL